MCTCIEGASITVAEESTNYDTFKVYEWDPSLKMTRPLSIHEIKQIGKIPTDSKLWDNINSMLAIYDKEVVTRDDNLDFYVTIEKIFDEVGTIGRMEILMMKQEDTPNADEFLSNTESRLLFKKSQNNDNEHLYDSYLFATVNGERVLLFDKYDFRFEEVQYAMKQFNVKKAYLFKECGHNG